MAAVELAQFDLSTRLLYSLFPPSEYGKVHAAWLAAVWH